MGAEGNWRAATEDEAFATELEYARCWKMMIPESHITQVTGAALQAVESQCFETFQDFHHRQSGRHVY